MESPKPIIIGLDDPLMHAFAQFVADVEAAEAAEAPVDAKGTEIER
jgi:hypothetical protein